MNFNNPKLFTLNEVPEKRCQLRESGEKLVLTNGCFDLLHAGHMSYLKDARELGDILWIALNSDQSVKSLKAPSRPIQSQLERAFSLSCLSFVDGIIIFNTQRLTNEILAIQPDIYAKAGDYTLETLNIEERNALEQVNADIKFLPFVPGYSTSSLIEKIKNADEKVVG